jgi:nuclear transport factor 2 (NTF2) superfamily protein
MGSTLAGVETGDAARRWAATWQDGWSRHDVEAIAALYAEDALFRSHPCREPEPARTYIERVFSEEASADPRFAEPIVEGTRAAVEWSAETTLKSGAVERLVGVSLLQFDALGLVREHRDLWCDVGG